MLRCLQYPKSKGGVVGVRQLLPTTGDHPPQSRAAGEGAWGRLPSLSGLAGRGQEEVGAALEVPESQGSPS